MPVSLPEDEQSDAFYRSALLVECNDALAQMYGVPCAADLIGARMDDFMDRSDPAKVEYLRAFIRSGYRLSDGESRERAADGTTRVFLNIDWHIATGELHCSQQSERIFGLEPGDFEQTIDDWERRLLPEDGHRVRQELARAMVERRTEIDLSFQTVRADGEAVRDRRDFVRNIELRHPRHATSLRSGPCYAGVQPRSHSTEVRTLRREVTHCETDPRASQVQLDPEGDENDAPDGGPVDRHSG